MPVGLRRFLFSKEFTEADANLAKTYAISAEKMEQVGDIIMDIVFNDESLQDGVEKIRAIVVPDPIQEANWKVFVSDLIRQEFWPARDLFGEELSFWLAEQQIGTGGWSTSRVLLKPLTYSAAASELAQRAGFSLMGSQLRERLRDLIVSKIKGVRIDAQIREVLMRQQDFGGLGLDAKQADATIVALNDILDTVEVLSETEFADWLAEETQKNQAASSTGGAVESAPASETGDEAEIAVIKSKMSAQPIQPASVLEQAVAQTMLEIPHKPTDEYLLRRMQSVISSRLRDVRNAIEMRQILLRDSKVGGVGLTQEQAEEVVEKVEAAYVASHGSIMEDEKKKLEAQTLIQQQKIEERKKREAEEHAKWYQEKILAKKQADDRQSQMAEQYRKTLSAAQSVPPAVPQAPIDVKEQQLEKQRFGNMVPAAVVAHPEVKVSLATVQIQGAGTVPLKPKIDGVVPPAPQVVGVVSPGPRLVGLMGELSELTLTDFRRMAKTPEQAVEKIAQKIETLAQESFEKRVEGIRAFQASPLQGAYMALVGESFRSGKPVATLADEKRAKGENTLSPAEVASIITLNSKLHF